MQIRGVSGPVLSANQQVRLCKSKTSCCCIASAFRAYLDGEIGDIHMAPTILKNSEIFAGDVLICYSAMLVSKGELGGSGYSHVAIALKEGRVLESNHAGVRITIIPKLLEDYDHIAVMRNPELWNPTRLLNLEGFANESLGKKFNTQGMYRYAMRKKELLDTAMEKVKGYFEGAESDVKADRQIYFCSELVTSAFIQVGIIDKSAAILFAPEAISPEDIGRDKAFGLFCGYLISHPDYKIPLEDYFTYSL